MSPASEQVNDILTSPSVASDAVEIELAHFADLFPEEGLAVREYSEMSTHEFGFMLGVKIVEGLHTAKKSEGQPTEQAPTDATEDEE